MRFKYFIYTLLIGLILPFTAVYAQSSANIDLTKVKSSMLSDAQIAEIYKKYENLGLSNEEAFNKLIEQGLDPTEASLIRKRLENIQSGGKLNKNTLNSRTVKESTFDYSRDSVRLNNSVPVKNRSRIYGAELFSNPKLGFEPNLRIATPTNYVLGPDDEVNVIFTGLNEAVTTAKVSPEGNLQIARVGLVYVNGNSIDQAYTKIKEKAKKIYPALATGQTKLNVTLGSVRSIHVTIIGEVAVQGTYTLSSLSSLFNALYQSGGPTENGSLRNIEVIRGNKVVQTADLYSFIQKGHLSNNILLRDQDVIRVPPYTKRVAIDGAVRRPGLYELKGEETIADLLKYTGGFSDNAYKSIAKLNQFGEKERSVKDIPSTMFEKYVLRNADSVFFGTILERYSNRVNIEGAVFRPGQFELTNGLTLKQLISKADGLREDAYMGNGYIKRTNPNLEKAMISFDLAAIMNGKQADLALVREDTVVIVSAQNLKENLSVTIDGNVQKPSSFPYRRGMSVADALSMANGFTLTAASHRVEISRLVKNTSDSVFNNLVNIITLNLDSAMQNADGQFKLEPLDYIYVPRLVNYRSLGNVKIRGEVLFPGDYPLRRRDETGSEFIQRAGGVTPVGSLENAQIFRDKKRLDISLIATNSKRNISATILMEGDSVYIPRKIAFVEVAGEVNNPQLLNFVSTNFQYYINAAGGLTEHARLKGAYVQYPNGTNQPVKRFLFFKNYPRVIAGSKIIVPESKAIPVKLGVGEISAIASALTALITVIAILVK